MVRSVLIDAAHVAEDVRTRTNVDFLGPKRVSAAVAGSVDAFRPNEAACVYNSKGPVPRRSRGRNSGSSSNAE